MASKIYKTYFFFMPWVRKIFWDPFWWLILFAIILWVPFLRPWWWFFLPLMLSIQLKTLYLWWIMWDFWYARNKWIVLEMIPPKEVLTPFKAMEDVFNSLWPIYDSGRWRERWCEGEFGKHAYWFSWEIVSAEGSVHFYLRCLAEHKRTIISILYGHYPEIEVREVPDYLKVIPQDVPNQEWNLYGEDWVFVRKPDCYPIKTFEKFFEPQGERISAEEKRIDPIASLLEGLSKLGPEEHFWVQFITTPVTDDEVGLSKIAKKEIDRIARRPIKREKTLLEDTMELMHNLILGPTKEGSGEKATYKWLSRKDEETGEDELLLTPGEREILTAVEDKIKKPIYKCSVRATYCAKREVWNGASKNVGRGYFGHFTTQHLNSLGFTGDTRPKVHYIFRKRRAYSRARRMFRNIINRFPADFPNMYDYTVLLNPEELATLFHFPNKLTGLVSPTVARVESKKAGPPSDLPVE